MIPIIDGHLDLAWNAVSFERDLTLPIDAINAAERDCHDSAARGGAVVSLAEMRRGQVMLCFATLLSRSNPSRPLPSDGVRRIDLDHRSQTVAHCAAHAQLAWYEQMVGHRQMRFVRTTEELDAHWREATESTDVAPIGMVLVMEGADPVTQPEELEYWYGRGLRQINLVHYGTNRYAAGTGAVGGLTEDGRRLLKECERLGVALDVTHLADQAFFEALDAYAGPTLASHQNCRSLVPGCRQFSDSQLRLLIERDAVIGTSFDDWMLCDGWKTGQTPRETVTLQNVADHIDHICQLSGHDRCAAIGTDLDGGFGCKQAPNDVSSIADVQKLAAILASRGYSDQATAAIFHGNWLRWLRGQLPRSSDPPFAPPASVITTNKC
jgi:membrane dipeptidase